MLPIKEFIKNLIKRGRQDLALDDLLSREVYKDFLRRISKKQTARNMEGKFYQHHSFGLVRVIIQPNYKAGGPRNLLIRTSSGQEVIVPQRSLRLPPGGGSLKKGARS